MGIREKINESNALAYSLFAGVVALAVGIFVWTNYDRWRGPVSRIYFSDDDGKTYFADSVNLVPPFDHNGRQAVAAYVYRAGSNPPFVGYLQKYDADVAKRIREVLARPANDETPAQLMQLRSRALVKRPGEASWAATDSGRGGDVATIAPPPGQAGELKSVNP